MQKILLSITLGLILCVSTTYPRGNFERHSDKTHVGQVHKKQHELNKALDIRQVTGEKASIAMQEANKAKKEAVDAAEALVEAAQEKVNCAQRALEVAQKELDAALADAAVQFRPVSVMMMNDDSK